jgi:hypothetical protein
MVKELAENRTKVTLNRQKKRQLFAFGAGGRIADKYYKAVSEILKEESTATNQEALTFIHLYWNWECS